MVDSLLFDVADLDALCRSARTSEAGVDEQSGRRLAAEALLIVGLICLVQDAAEFAQRVSSEVPLIEDQVEVSLLGEMVRILVADVKGQPGAPAPDVIDEWGRRAILLVDGSGV